MKRKKVYLVPILALMFVLSWALSGAWAGDGVVNTTVKDFRVNLDRTVTDTSKPVNVVVELLDEQGRVDVFGETSVSYIYVSAGSVIGNIHYNNISDESGNDGGSFAAQTAKIAVENGRAGFHIKYNQPGTDTLRFYVVVVDTDGDTLTLGPKEYEIQVTEAPNQAKALKLISMTPDNTSRDNKEITYNATTDAADNGAGQIDAGEAFTLKIKACEDFNCTGYTSYQNGPITIKFIPETTPDSDGNSAYSADCSNVVTVNGTMENGIAFVHVPEETLTKAGEYKIYAEMDSAATISGKAKLVQNKHIYVDALGPAKVKASLDRDYINDTNIVPPTLTLSLIDKYGNLADTNDVTSVDVTVSATNNVVFSSGSSTTITISGNNTANFSNFKVKTGKDKPSTSNDTGTGTSTLSISCSDYEVDTPELTLTIYQKKLVVDIKDRNFTAGIVKESAIQVCAGDDGNSTIKSANCTDPALVGKRVKVELYDGNTKVDEVTSVVGENGTVNLKFTKALKGDGNETLKVFYLSSGYQYEPGEDTDTITVNPADAYVMKLYEEQSRDYDACAGTGTPTEEIDSITSILSNNNATIIVHGSKDNSTPANGYFIRIEDAYGNEITNGTIYVQSDADPLNPTPKSAQFNINSNATITYKEVGTDNLTFYTDIPGVDGITVPVTITKTTGSLISSIEVIPATEYVLTNGEIPVVVRAKDQNGDLISWKEGDLTLLVDNPNYVTIRKKDRTNEIDNGENLPASTSGEYTLSLLASNTEGDVTLTIRNASGSVQGQATVHIVKSVNDIPAAVSQVSFSPASVTIAPNESVNVTLQVVDSEGNGVANKVCTISTDAENVAKPASTTVTTGNDGTVEITINAGSVEGVAHITATCEGQSAVLTATVTSETAPITLSQNNVTVTQGNTATVTVSGGTAPYNVSSSDKNIATVDVSDDTITITGVAEGTATITVTDSSDPAQTAEIQVTVKAGAGPQPVPTEPTQEEITDVSTAPVNLGEVASGTGDTMEMTVNFPPYENPVDIYVGILLPRGDLYVLQSDNTFTTQLVPYAQNVTDAVSAQVFEPFSVCTPFGPAIPEGTYYVYTLVVPTGADLGTMDWGSAPYDLSYYSFDVSCD